MSWLNVFEKTWSTLPWFHPRNLKYLKSDFDCAKQRITRGWCYRDWYNLDNWTTTVLPELLEDFVKNHHGLPNKDYSKIPPEPIHWVGNCYTKEEQDKFNKDYEKYLLEIAQHFRNAREEYYDSPLKDKLTYPEFEEYCQGEINKALDMLKPVFFELWD